MGEFWRSLSVRERVIFGFFTAGVAALIAAIVLWAGRPEYGVLVSGASDDEIREVVSMLDEKGEKYRIEADKILVPAGRKPALVAELARRGVVAGDKIIGFVEVLERDTFYTTRDRRRLMMRIALQNELALMLANIKGIERAGVLIKEGKEADIFGEGKPAGASVSVTPAAGSTLTPDLVRAVTSLVRSAVPNIDAQDITVVDARDGRVQRADLPADDADEHGFFALKRDVEKTLADKVRSLFVGMGIDSVVVVDAKLHLDRVKERWQELDPQQRGPYYLSERRSKSTAAALPVTMGPVGAEANRVAGTTIGAGAGVAAAGPATAGSQPTSEERDRVMTYSYILKEIVRAPQGIVDSTASVVLFDRLVIGLDGKAAYDAKSVEDNLADFRLLAANALGIKPEQVVVKHVTSGQPAPEAVAAGVVVSIGVWRDIAGAVVLALLVLAGIAGAWLLLRSFLERPPAEAAEALPGPPADRIEMLQRAIREQISTQPERIARILSRWIASG